MAGKDKKPITKDTMIKEIVEQYPELIWQIQKQGIRCIGCCVATWETLEQGASSCRIDVEKLVEKLNQKLKRE